MLQNDKPNWFVINENGQHKPVATAQISDNVALFIDIPAQKSPAEAAEAAAFFCQMLEGTTPPKFTKHTPVRADDPDVLIYYDEPQLVIRESDNGRKYLCVATPEEEGAPNPWVLVEASETLIAALRESRISLAEAFRMGTRRFIANDFFSPNGLIIPIEDIPESHLPSQTRKETKLLVQEGINVFIQQAKNENSQVITPSIVSKVCSMGYDTERIHADMLELVAGRGTYRLLDTQLCAEIAWRGGDLPNQTV